MCGGLLQNIIVIAIVIAFVAVVTLSFLRVFAQSHEFVAFTRWFNENKTRTIKK